MHVPLVSGGPGIPRRRLPNFAYLYDIYPTARKLAGVVVPDGLDGRSLLRVITGKTAKVRGYAFTAAATRSGPFAMSGGS